MTALSPNAAIVYAALLRHADLGGDTDAAGFTWRQIYLDNAKPAEMTRRQFAGYLSALQAAGLYRSQGDDCFGLVRVPAVPAPTPETNAAIAALESGLVASGAIEAKADVWPVVEREHYTRILARPNRHGSLQSACVRTVRSWSARINGRVVRGFGTRRAAIAAAIEAPAMVPQPVQQQQANAGGAARPNVTMQWADEAVRAKPFGHGRANQGECHRDEACGVRLIQDGIDSFTVVYGKQVKRGLSYGAAAAEYGQAVMHALACDAMLDNREPRRR